MVDKDGVPKKIEFEASSLTSNSVTSCPDKPDKSSPRGSAPSADRALIGEQCYEDPATLGANLRYTVGFEDDDEQLEPGDVITVKQRALIDERGNPSRLYRYTVTPRADEDEFQVARASVGNVRHAKQASLLIRNTPETTKRLQIAARNSGVAAGAAGNDWVVYPYVAPDRREPHDSTIRVGADPIHRIISYTIADGKVTLANLAAGLNANSMFSRHFTARAINSTAADDGVLDIDDASGERLGATSNRRGRSLVGVRLLFTDHVQNVSFDTGDRKESDFFAPDLLASVFVPGRDVGGAGDLATDKVEVRCQRRGKVVYLEYNTTEASLLPQSGTLVWIPSGVATNYGGESNRADRQLPLRADATVPTSFGYRAAELSKTDTDARSLRCDGDDS